MANAVLAEEIKRVESQIVTSDADGIPTLRGGQYTAIQDADGTFCLKRVEIFSEVAEGERGNKEPIDREWLVACMKNMQARYRAERQYIAAVHVNHHDRPTEDCGYFVPVAVEKCKLSDGTETWTILADLFKIPAATYARIRANRLCYRSVEIIKYAEKELGTLALMADEVPHFRYAMTTVGTEITRAQQPVAEFAADKPFLFRAENGAKFMADDEEKKKKKPEGDGGEEKKSAPPFGKEGEDGKQEGGDENGNGGETPPAEGAEASEVLKVVQAGMGEIKMLLTALLAMASGQQGGSTNSISATPVQMKAVKAALDSFRAHKVDTSEIDRLVVEVEAKFKAAPAAGVEAKTDSQEDEMSDPKLAAEVAAARNDIATFRKERELDRLKAFAFSALEGHNIVADTKAYIEQYITENPDEKKVKEFVEFFKKTATADPLPLEAYSAGMGAAKADLPKEVVEAQARGPEAGEAELRMFRAYESDCKTFGKRRSYEQFKKAEELRTQALDTAQGGRGGLPLFTGRA